MNERTAIVVEGFKRLTTKERILAYMEIEEIWKSNPKGNAWPWNSMPDPDEENGSDDN